MSKLEIDKSDRCFGIIYFTYKGVRIARLNEHWRDKGRYELQPMDNKYVSLDFIKDFCTRHGVYESDIIRMAREYLLKKIYRAYMDIQDMLYGNGEE